MQSLINLDKLADLLELRELYRADRTKNYIGYYTLTNYIKWFEQEPQLQHTEIRVYSFNGNWYENGLYLIVDRYQLMVNSLKAADPDLKAALKLLDWSRGYKITSLHQSHYASVRDALLDLQVSWRMAKMNVYHMSAEKALAQQVSCPDGFKVHTLRVAEAECVDSLWSPRQPGSLTSIERFIKFNTSIGVYTTNNEHLVAWCTRCQCGFLGTLHVLEDFRMRNLAMLVVRSFARQVALSADDVYALVYEHNAPSNRLFQKLEFELVDQAYHIRAGEGAMTQ